MFIKDSGSIYAINLLTRTVIELSPEAYDTYLSLIEKRQDLTDDAEFATFVSALVEGMFIFADDFDELSYIRYRVNQERFSDKQLGVVIVPTMSCNFNCHYCFESRSNTDLKVINQNRILQLVATNMIGRRDLLVQWFGGEPLKALEIIENLSKGFMEITKKLGSTYSAKVVTNGYLMTKDVSRLLSDLCVKNVQITLDGDRFLHDRIRYENLGHGSFDVILKNIKDASEFFSIDVRIHVAPYSIESIKNLIDTLGIEGMSKHISKLYFAPIFNYKYAMKEKPYRTDGKRFLNSEEFAHIQVDLAKQASEWGLPLPDLFDSSYGICTAVRGDTIVIGADGNLFKCYKDVGVGRESIGNLEEKIIPIRNLLKWMDVPIPRDADCRGCQLLPLCLGGCPMQWLKGASKDSICTPLKYNMNEMAKIYLNRYSLRTHWDNLV